MSRNGRRRWWGAAAAVGAVAAISATTLPAQAVATGTTRLDCTVAGSTKHAAMDVNMTQISGSWYRLTDTKYATASPAFRAEEVRLMLQIDGQGDFATLKKWGDGTTSSVAPTGTSNLGPDFTPHVHLGTDRLKLKISEAGGYMDCTVRPVGWTG